MVRRTDRQITEAEALAVLLAGEFGVLSTVSAQGRPYGVPVNYCVLDRDIYFHCAVEGVKLDNLEHSPEVSFCVIGATELPPQPVRDEVRELCRRWSCIRSVQRCEAARLGRPRQQVLARLRSSGVALHRRPARQGEGLQDLGGVRDGQGASTVVRGHQPTTATVHSKDGVRR
jgi:hypothetical protein